MKLKKLLKNIPYKEIKGSKEIEITGVSADSKKVFPGNLFIAKKGSSFDGSEFIPEAVSAGAIAVVTDLYDPFLPSVVQIVHDNPASIEADIAAEYYQYPANDLFMVGITGTNGKTTTSYLVKHLLDSLQKPSGLIGTIEYITGKSRFFSSRTTPDVIMVQKLLKEMRLHECESCVMEVSSHGIEQKRIAHIDFDVAIFTNLTQDHLDYHHTMEEYAQAKQKLFSTLSSQKNKKPCFAILNKDSPYGSFMGEKTPASIMTYGIHSDANVKASEIKILSDGMEFLVSYQGQKEVFTTSLIGDFNVSNLLAAICVGLSLLYSLKELKPIISSFIKVSGRLERVKISQKFHVYVDYAHTPDALENVLLTIRKFCKKRIITLFGCGGNRDKDKRPKMARAVEKFSDLTIVTSDNPRNEKPEEIIQEILKGFEKKGFFVEIDRKEAIKKALSMAEEDDVVLIAGKGHENYQIFGNTSFPFDDCEVIREIAKEL
jgi:UDP-N-acetylmuramoyl-L-alanyl-D-glutamate--2,6-diaminopimelate ligase